MKYTQDEVTYAGEKFICTRNDIVRLVGIATSLRADRDYWKKEAEGSKSYAALREQLRLSIIDAAQNEAEANDLRAEVEEWKEYSRNVCEEKCAGDEIHCTCVPALRKRIRQLEEAVGKCKLYRLSITFDPLGVRIIEGPIIVDSTHDATFMKRGSYGTDFVEAVERWDRDSRRVGKEG